MSSRGDQSTPSHHNKLVPGRGELTSRNWKRWKSEERRSQGETCEPSDTSEHKSHQSPLLCYVGLGRVGQIMSQGHSA